METCFAVSLTSKNKQEIGQSTAFRTATGFHIYFSPKARMQGIAPFPILKYCITHQLTLSRHDELLQDLIYTTYHIRYAPVATKVAMPIEVLNKTLFKHHGREKAKIIHH